MNGFFDPDSWFIKSLYMAFTIAWTATLAYLLLAGTVVDPRDVFPGWMSAIGILFIFPGIPAVLAKELWFD